MAAIPESVSKALEVLNGDQDALVNAEVVSGEKDQAALEATHASEVARAAVDAASSQRDSDKQALIKLIDETYK